MEENKPRILPDQAALDEEPERFDPTLLAQPKASRMAWFEKECTIEHLSLLQARDAVLRTICSPGEGPRLNRLGTMVLLEKSTVLSILMKTNFHKSDLPPEVQTSF